MREREILQMQMAALHTAAAIITGVEIGLVTNLRENPFNTEYLARANDSIGAMVSEIDHAIKVLDGG